MKVIISESILKEYSQDILSPSKDHPTFAKITENDAMLWSDFGQDLALKVFKLSKDDLIALCGKNNRGAPNGQINWYKVDRAGFIPTGYRIDGEGNAPGFVMTQTTTFGFNITIDPLKLNVVYGNAFLENNRSGQTPNWKEHLRYFLKTGKKALTGDTKKTVNDFFDKLSSESGYKSDFIFYLIKKIYYWGSNTEYSDIEKCKYLSCIVGRRIFKNSKIFDEAIQNFKIDVNKKLENFEIPQSGTFVSNNSKNKPVIFGASLQILCDIVDEHQQYNEKEIDDYLNDMPRLSEEEKTELKNLAKQYATEVINFIKSIKS